MSDLAQAEAALIASVHRWSASLYGRPGCDRWLEACARACARAVVWCKATGPADARAWEVLALAKREVSIRKNELLAQHEAATDPDVAEYGSLIEAQQPVVFAGGLTPHGSFERLPPWVIHGAMEA